MGGPGKLAVEDGQVHLVVFTVGGDFYAVDIMRVVEIHRLLPIKRVPGSPSFLEGVVNLRGDVLPVIDLRRRFEANPLTAEKLFRIIQVRLEGDLESGMIVDEVREVTKIQLDRVREAPGLVARLEVRYLLGVVDCPGGQLLLVLDVDELLTSTEKRVIREVAEEAGQEPSEDSV